MLATIRARRGQGNAAIYVRARNTSAQFWDFVGLAWGTEIANAKVFLPEFQDADVLESRYQTQITLPSGTDVTLEYVHASDSSVLGEDGPSITSVAVASIPAPDLSAVAKTTDVTAARDAVLTAIPTDLTGVATTADVAAAVSAITAHVDSRSSGLTSLVLRALSLLGANTVRDMETLDGLGRTVSARIRSYDTAANAALKGAMGLIATYTINASYDQSGACAMTVTEVVA